MFHVHEQENSILSRYHFFPTSSIDSMHFQAKHQQDIFWHWQTDFKVYMGRQKTQTFHLNVEEEKNKVEELTKHNLKT